MKKYNIPNYVRYKNDLKSNYPTKQEFYEYSRNDLIVKFLPLVENVARKFSTTEQASGVLDITDLIQHGAIGLCGVPRSTWSRWSATERCGVGTRGWSA